MANDGQAVTLRSIAAAAFLPPALFSVSVGAITPVVPLTATALGATPALAAVVVALTGLGQLLADAPAGALTARFGERPVMIGAGLLCAAALAVAMLSQSLLMFAAAMFVMGMGTAVWMLARLTFVADLVPFVLRARAMSTLGGVQRIGLFIGPFLGAAAVHFFGTPGAYGVGLVAVLVAAGVLVVVTEPTDQSPAGAPPQVGYRQMLRSEAGTFATLGLGVLLVSVVRASRQVVLPLWGEHLALAPATISLIYGLSGAVDMLLFYPAGRLMDLRGRAVVAISSMLGLAAAHLLLPLTGSPVTLTLVAMLMGLGNGMGSGLVMTIGADLAPPGQRPVFFGIWRLVSDTGTGVGPFVLAGITAAISLGAGVLAMGGAGLAAAAAMGYWIPRRATPRDRPTPQGAG
jgi:MFS family permease